MKKPINKVALVLWVIAVLVAAAEMGSLVLLRQSMAGLASQAGETYLVVNSLWAVLRGAVLSSSQLVALGVIIELVDQIRWNALQQPRH